MPGSGSPPRPSEPAGVALSGCSSRPTAFGGAWDDAHLPPGPVEAASLLTPPHIRNIAAAPDKATTGIKQLRVVGAGIVMRHGEDMTTVLFEQEGYEMLSCQAVTEGKLLTLGK